jgi:sigma-B regulation protein RsbU (phosphoserine phosphatase)
VGSADLGADVPGDASEGVSGSIARPKRVLIVTPEDAAWCRGMGERVVQAWPGFDGVARPDFEPWKLAAFERALEERDWVWSTLREAGAVIFGAWGTPKVTQLVDLLDRARVPTVFVAPDGQTARKLLGTCDLEERGLVVLTGKNAPERAAHVLQGLAIRQPLVDRLADEARVGLRAQANVQAQLEHVEAELREAARVQQNFAHRPLPDVPGLDVGVVYRPAGHVSGDVFDVEMLDENRVGFFLADAAGHGVPAAMLTLYIARALPKTERRDGKLRVIPPGEALCRLNHDFATRPGVADRFATAVYGVYDLRTRELTVAGAGHPAPILANSDGPAERIETDGPLLGVFDDAAFSEVSLSLNPGQSLVVFSDGWEVAFPEAGADGDRLRIPTRTYLGRLESFGRACARDGVNASLAAIASDLDGQSGSLHQPDDVTALVLSATAVAQTLAA